MPAGRAGRHQYHRSGAGNVFCQQTFNLWKDALNPFGTTIQVQFPSATFFFFETLASGFEALMTLVNADVQIDRPVTVSGQPVAVRSKNSVLILAVGKTFKLIYLFDDNILADYTDLNHVSRRSSPSRLPWRSRMPCSR